MYLCYSLFELPGIKDLAFPYLERARYAFGRNNGCFQKIFKSSFNGWTFPPQFKYLKTFLK